MAVTKSATRKAPAAAHPPTKTDLSHDTEVSRNLRILRSILDAPVQSPVTSTSTKARRPKTPLATATTRGTNAPRTIVSKSKSKSKNADKSVVKKEDVALEPLPSLAEQRKLAMNSFNQSLKVLSAVVKKQQLNRQQEAHDANIATLASNEAETAELNLHAECACAGLDVLRQTERLGTDTEDSIQKREQAAILLLEKMISLDMRNLAYEAASKTYEQYWERRSGKDTEHEIATRRKMRHLALPELLVQSDSLKDGSHFHMVCSFQSQIIRLAILQGPESITSDFVQAISLDAPGSPANVICSGHDLGHLDQRRAGDNLRTIAQALSKLYSTAVKTDVSSVESRSQNLALFVEAQIIRLASWNILGRQINLDQELWTPLERALKHFWHQQGLHNASGYGLTTRSIDRVRHHLHAGSLSAKIPSKLSALLAQLAEANNDLSLAEEYLADLSSQTAGSKKLFYQCRLVTIQLDEKRSIGTVPHKIHETVRSLENVVHADVALSSDDLLGVVRLRKACSQQLSMVPTHPTEPNHIELGTTCLQLLCSILQFCASQLHETCQKDSKIRQSLRLSVLKTIEAILDAEKYATGAGNEACNLFLHQLDSCKTCLTGFGVDRIVEDEADHSAVLDSLKVRLSNVFWRAHARSDSSNEEEWAMSLTQKSIACLEGISIEGLNKAALGPRLEKLASMHVAAHASMSARAVLEQAIKHYIAADALVDAVEVSLSKQSSKAWTDPASLASQLSRALHSYGALYESRVNVEAPAQSLYDDETLPAIHRAILLEHQLLHLLKNSRGKAEFESLFEHAQLVMKLACLPQHCVWRLRFASILAFHVLKLQGLENEKLTAIDQLLSTANENCMADGNSFLYPYRSILMVLTTLQRGLITHTFHASSIKESLACLRSAIKDRKSVTKLDEVIDNYGCLLSTLRAYGDQAMAVHEDVSAVTCLSIRVQLLQCGVSGEEHEELGCHIDLARFQVRLDDLDAAKSSLAKAHALVLTNDTESRMLLELHLVEAEYHLACVDPTAVSKCRVLLDQAQVNVCAVWPQDMSLNSAKQIGRDEVVARGALLASLCAGRLGNLADASRYARQAAKISISIWAALEKRSMKCNTPSEDSIMVSPAADISKLNITTRSSINGAVSCGAKYWKYLDLHLRSLRHAVSILAHVGLLDDALHYARQLRSVMLPMTSSSSFPDPDALIAILYAKSKQGSDASRLLAAREAYLRGSCHEPTMDELLSSAEAYLVLGQRDAARRLVQKARPLLAAENDPKASKAPNKAEAKKSSTTPSSRLARAKNIKATAISQEGISRTCEALSRVKKTIVTPCYSYKQLRNDDWRKALLLRLAAADENNCLDTCSETNAARPRAPPCALVQEMFAMAKSKMSKAWHRLCTDSMQAVFTESAVALPSKYVSSSRTGRVSFLQGTSDQVDISPSQLQGPSNHTAGFSEIATLLQSAHNDVNLLLTESYTYCSTEMIHALVKMEARISLLLTTMGQPFTTSSTELVLKALQPMDEALLRERMVALAESATQDKSSISLWPKLRSGTASRQEAISPTQLKDLPSSWSIVSLALAEDNNELLVSKIVAGRSPFLLRIPLHRSNEGDGVEEFMFDDAQMELRDIIAQANSSSHDVRGTADKAIRAQWHADREKLDRRLELLLSNVESIWLGGFRGTFSPRVFDEKQLSQFGKALTRCLDKHLPSRRMGGANTLRKVEIHDHILEIFLALGDLEEDDLDDAIIDLLYFVVDIFQFDGERNAYDEIDWDAMLVDILDALRVPHTVQPAQPPRHTILILDKELESFPWESLPCLINHPVSRMPSLSSVFDRLTEIRAQRGHEHALAISKSTAHVGSIINPSGDLTSTQTLFEPILESHIPASQSTYMTNAPPSEPQFSSLLGTSDIVLYFGHGSGAQYIRGRTIRSLPRSAVTFLFGCSSAKMFEHGVFESTGMPRYYMLGNSPAVVGCLWDVTDREIDRVALRTLSGWGLLDVEDERVKDGLKLKGKKNKERRAHVAAGDDTKRTKTLVEAVQGGRQACVLRYLCGAAVVMYGVPVVLENE